MSNRSKPGNHYFSKKFPALSMCRNPANRVNEKETYNSSIFDTTLRNLEEHVYTHTE